MSRSGYSEDGDYADLWRANVERTVAGKRGQSFLRELVEALEAMPEKRLITNDLKTENGEVCAIGAVGVKRGLDVTRLDPYDAEAVGKTFGISSMMAQEITYLNDERFWKKTPEERWHFMHEWAKNNLKAGSP